ncbi:MAG TPA: apolipoprotein N-acyltransferase, partial [Candidatus Omnitrophota bacterium]|nr:apolipoprotein N-acyltransferase [Candidatus Omnitrophota bacterium]
CFYWIYHVTFLGLALLVFYFALYFGLFGLAYYFSYREKPLRKLFFLPSVWVVLEFFRAHLFSGFSWASLGLSQYKILPVIQIADLTGVYGISFLIVMGNVCLKEFLSTSQKMKIFFAVLLTVFCLGLTLGYGQFRLKNKIIATGEMNISIIQPSIKMADRWQESLWKDIIEEHFNLSRKAVLQKTDLVIWPESSLPGIFSQKLWLFHQLANFVRDAKTPFLIGAVTHLKDEFYFNSALLFSSDGEVMRQYDKWHLVPYGEYIPFRKYFPFLKYIVPIDDFTSGRELTIFSLGALKFSVLICFEDSVAYLSREFIKHGAQALVNITNDDWFKKSSALFMHVQSSVFRAVENRKSVIRVANTGVSCFINPWGKIVKKVQNKQGQSLYVKDIATDAVVFNSIQTFYTKFGDVFAFVCFLCILIGIIIKKN